MKPLIQENHPIDNYSREIMQSTVKGFILYPGTQFDLLLPLQQLGRLTNLSQVTPLSIDINCNFGLWFAFRGVYLSREKMSVADKLDSWQSPCLSCELKPCLLGKTVGEARLLCPYKSEHRYSNEQNNYHKLVLQKQNS
jgi:epoxyqueuosine reductase